MSTTGVSRGSYAKTEKRRREILRAGIAVFSDSGFRGGSIREIAERVGMSQAGVLHHFSSKSELLAEVLRQRDREAWKRMGSENGTGIHSIRLLVELAEHNATVPGLVELHCLLSAEATALGHPAHEYFIDRYASVVASTTASFRIMRANGELVDGVDPDSAAKGLVALMDGLQVQWLLDPGSIDMAQALRGYLRPLLTVEL